MLKQVIYITSLTLTLNTLINLFVFLNNADDELLNYNSIDDDLQYDIANLVKKYEYPFENHTVITEDGYILQLHRIPHGKHDLKVGRGKRKAILVQHGIFVSSMVWLMEGPSRSLAYKLADAGYDVWLGNNRGNAYSKQHIAIDVANNPQEYYNYSWHEIGFYDLAASIDYIVNVTGHAQIDYAGHSQGSIAFFVLMNQRPVYNQKIRVMVAMAPTVYTQHTWSPLLYIGGFFNRQVEWFFRQFNVYHLLSGSMFGGKHWTIFFCADGYFLQPLCRWTFYTIGGYNPPQLNTTLLPLIFTHCPVGTSAKQIVHYLQIFQTGIFRQYDYGAHKNLIKYGQLEPPDYTIANVTVPVAVYYSQNDFYSSEQDTIRLVRELPNVISVEKVSDQHFTHFNFMFGKNIHQVLNSRIINFLRRFQLRNNFP